MRHDGMRAVVQASVSVLIPAFNARQVVVGAAGLDKECGDQRFLYCARADVTASGAGEAAVLLGTLLRRPPSDNAVVELAQPMIEGFVRDLGEWTVGVERLVSLQFTVRERE